MTPSSPRASQVEKLLAHAGCVRGLARALVPGDADVDDVVQETWLGGLGSRDADVHRPRSWLASIVRRRAARHLRTRARANKRHAQGPRAPKIPASEESAARHAVIHEVSDPLRSPRSPDC